MNQSSLRPMFLLCRETGLSADPILLWDDCDGAQSADFRCGKTGALCLKLVKVIHFCCSLKNAGHI